MKSRRTVLIVDDQEINRLILSKILEDEYQILLADDGLQAIELLRQRGEAVCAVLLDVVMPVMDGYEVLKLMRCDDRLSSMPVIVTTQKNDDHSEIAALQYGANDFISKPYHPKLLKLRLNNLIQMSEAKATITVLEKDLLTGLLTRTAFIQRVEERLERSAEEACQIIAFDIEQFKIFNDTYGELEGDELLKFATGVLKAQFGDRGLIARGYADQFFVFCEQAEDTEERLSDIAETIKTYHSKAKIFVKIGIYTIVQKTESVRAMCDWAILAAETIKEHYDKNFCYYDDSFRKKIIGEQLIAGVMNESLKNREFHVYYQPKFGAESENIVGAEALVRWIHPEFGFMSPGEFIPLFEKNGFITELDKYVWEEVCRFLKKQKDLGVDVVPVSVNVSRKDIYEEDLVPYFESLIEKYELDARYLHLEITESAYSENPEQLIETAVRLRKSGFVLEMDDFGSGYSSLNTLSELPIDVLKLDMKFIQSEYIHKNSNNVISSVINLARWMNLLVIAEGVESKEQLVRLRELKCNIIQGYYFSKPVPQEEFEQMLLEKTVVPVYDVNSYVRILAQRNPAIQEENIMLIIDDLAMNRSILSEYFQSEYNVEQCGDGLEAWEYIQNNYENISIIMLDLYMPGMDGFTLIKKIKEHEIYRRIPVVITSQPDEKLEHRISRLQGDAFLAKPYVKEAAMQIVNDVLTRMNHQSRIKEAELQKRLSEAEHKASYDGLTEVYNRTTLEKRVSEYLAGQTANSVFIVLDIDDFKEINDQYGHISGDKALVTVSEILKSRFRSEDDIGRLGGDEFGILMKADFDDEELNLRMEKLCRSLRFVNDGKKISCSIGVFRCCKEEENDFSRAYEKADAALRNAKSYGKNQYQIFGAKTNALPYISRRNIGWFLEQTPGGMFRYGAENDIIDFVNDNLYRMLGYEPAQFAARFHNHFSELIYPLDRERILKQIARHRSGLDTGAFEYRVEKRNGEICWFHDSRKLMIEDEIPYYYVNVIDLTADMLVREGNRRDLKRLTSILKNIPGGICLYSFTGKHFEPLFLSDAFYRMLGVSETEELKRVREDSLFHVHPEDRERFLEEILEAVYHTKHLDTVCRYKNEKKDQYVNVRVVANVVVQPDGSRLAYVCYMEL